MSAKVAVEKAESSSDSDESDSSDEEAKPRPKVGRFCTRNHCVLVCWSFVADSFSKRVHDLPSQCLLALLSLKSHSYAAASVLQPLSSPGKPK